MQKHQLKRKTKLKKYPKIGRGGKRGKTSGKGTKGQKARAGRKMRPEWRDLIKKIPKLRGRGVNINNPINQANFSVKLSTLQAVFEEGEKVTPQTLFEKGVIRKVKGKFPPIKIVNTGEIKKKLTVKGCAITAEAKKSIEAVKGEII